MRKTFLFTFLIIFTVTALARPLAAQEQSETPGELLARGAFLFAQMVVLPLDRDEFIVDLIREVADRLPGLEIVEQENDFIVVDHLDGDAAVELDQALIGKSRRLAKMADAWLAVRTDQDGAAIFQEALDLAIKKIDPYGKVTYARHFDRYVKKIDQQKLSSGLYLKFVPEGEEVFYVVPGSPADKAGLVKGDLVLAIEGVPLIGKTVPEIWDASSSSNGEGFRMTVRRVGRTDEEELLVGWEMRTVPPLKVDKLPGNILYVNLMMFSQQASRKLHKVLIKNIPRLARKGGLILDLRGNKGGYLDGARDVADLFLDKGVMFKSIGREDFVARVAVAHKQNTWSRLPLVVLIDHKTFSTAEMLASALAVHDRALVLGERSGGKGLAQSIIRLPLNRVLHVSMMRIEDPAGLVLQGYGVRPHVEVSAPDKLLHRKRQPYPWLDSKQAVKGPLLTVKMADLKQTKSSHDPLLLLAIETLQTWNDQRSLTLLEACRKAIPVSSSDDDLLQ